ncbi:hypothetical protein [Natronobiforma cellulositropha]|uniref:hypothetical protein n=1 Tax=Natronobiforma cellulositropha TaxID=1679076 RepID=UPI0021D5DF88|nr:hypothetical protein [Natronobiforma cellulositropha]
MVYSLQYYDLVLVAIAASMVLGALVAFVTPVAFEVAIPLFAVVAIAFIGHALFVNGPVDETDDLAAEVELEEVPAVLSPLETAPER